METGTEKYRTVQYSKFLYSTVLYRTVQYSSVEISIYSTVPIEQDSSVQNSY